MSASPDTKLQYELWHKPSPERMQRMQSVDKEPESVGAQVLHTLSYAIIRPYVHVEKRSVVSKVPYALVGPKLYLKHVVPWGGKQ
jgi:hypothetical protein